MISLKLFTNLAGCSLKTSTSTTTKPIIQPRHEEVQQVCIERILPVPAGCACETYHEGLRDQFLKTYKKDTRFEMSVQGLGTDTLRLEGRVIFAQSCQVKNARERGKNMLPKFHDGIEIPGVDPAFKAHLLEHIPKADICLWWDFIEASKCV